VSILPRPRAAQARARTLASPRLSPRSALTSPRLSPRSAFAETLPFRRDALYSFQGARKSSLPTASFASPRSLSLPKASRPSPDRHRSTRFAARCVLPFLLPPATAFIV
jgi:hypothetical protein